MTFQRGEVRALSATARKERQCAPSTQNQAFNTVLFLYREVLGKPLERVRALRAKRTAHVRTAPSHQQVASLLEQVEDVHDYPTRLIFPARVWDGTVRR